MVLSCEEICASGGMKDSSVRGEARVMVSQKRGALSSREAARLLCR